MLLVAVTGGIASGKSAVAARLAELGAIVVDADQLAREVVEPGTPALARIAEEFGPEVIAADGRLDRAALGAIVFADPERLAVLNAITHPAVRELSRARFAEAVERDPDAVVVYDVPLLVDARTADEFDEVIVVEAPERIRVERMVTLRGMSEAEAWNRIRSQISDAERRAIADHVIDSGATLEQTIEQVDALWPGLRQRAVSRRA